MRKNLTTLMLCSALAAFGCGDDDTPAGDTGPLPDTPGVDSNVGDTGGGGGDTGGGGGGMFCMEECTADEDCTVGTNDIGFTCMDGRCMGETAAPTCEEDAECVALFNGWQLGDSDGDFMGDTACTADSDAVGMCADGEVCCSIGFSCLESGYCAQSEPATGCFAPGVAVDETAIDGSTISVCAQPNTSDATCSDNACTNPCADNDECPDNFDCNAGSCGCANDTACGDSGLVCDTDSGACNCTMADQCTSTFDGTTASCG